MTTILASLAVVLGLGVGTTQLRAVWRARRAQAAFPPTGQFITVNGRRLHFRQAGQGPEIVLLHGASGSVREFAYGLMDALSQHYRVTAFDRPGLGYSDALAGNDPGLDAQALHLIAACDQMGIKAPLLVGQSFGGSVALAWALKGAALTGGPRALVLLGAPALPWPGGLDIWYRLNRAPLGQIMPWLAAAWIWPGYVARSLTGIFTPNPVPPGYADSIGAGLIIRRKTLASNVAQVNALRAQLVAMEPHYDRLTLPIELVHGEEDAVVPIHIHSRPLAARQANAHLTALPGTGHMPHHTNLPQVLAAIDRGHSRANMEQTRR